MEAGRANNIKIAAISEPQFPHIPGEIILLILSNLPVSSLIRFKCVSKSWCALISNPKFNLSTTQKRSKLVVVPDFHAPSCSINLINNDDDEVSAMEIPKPEAISQGNLPRSKIRIRGSCNGLLLVNVHEDLFLWNPSTRSCNRVFSHFLLNRKHPKFQIVSGLCYDSSTDDYKALMAIRGVIRQQPPNSLMEVMVGSLRNKTWTEINFPYTKFRIESGPVVNDRLHWLVTDTSYSHLILYFDPQTNEFVKVPMPPQLNEWKQITRVGLGVLNGCLSMAIHRNKGTLGNVDLEVLVMPKYGDNNNPSWFSLFNVTNIIGFELRNYYWVPLRYAKNGDVLLYSEGADTILWRNLEQNGATYVRNNTMAATFVESLASPSSYNWEEEEYMQIFLSGMTRKIKCRKGQRRRNGFCYEYSIYQ